ncbi:restriction system modified-DNA reader domain-containing protein [Isoptericola aurantiacus]|uniref:restriction system modified-DNA reader domain-containing protein n=1 Tax=Isoptericola aurantiacus TaxID=3377839 RepID=UPI00383AF1AA
MPLFEVDASRPLLVQSGRSAGAVEPGLGTTAHRVVDSHIDGLLGEQIFPVAQGAGPDEPHLLALDATGSPVVVELVAELDKAALTKALDHAGWAGRLTRGDLAGRYHGGANAFQRDIADFYDSVPITRSQPGRSSARLIVICQEAGEEILNAVDFLRQPTMPVEVLKMGVMHTQDGRRFVDVSPLVIHPASGAASPQVTSAPAAAATPSSTPAPAPERPRSPGEQPESFAEGVKVGMALTGKNPAVVSVPAEGAPAARPVPRGAGDTAEQPPVGRTRAQRRAAAGPPSLAVPSVRSDGGGSRAGAPVPAPQHPPVARPAERTRHAPVPPPPAAERPASSTGSAAGSARPAAEPPPAPRRRSRADRFRATSAQEAPPMSPGLAAFASASSAEDLDLAELARRTTSAASTDTPGLGEDFAQVAAPALGSRRSARRDPEPWEPPAHLHDDPLGERGRSSLGSDRQWDTPGRWTSASDDLPRLEVPPLEAPSYTPPPERGLYDGPAYPVDTEEEVDGDLIALASMLPQPARLEWVRPRRGQRFEAVLHPEGFIELADGSRFQHPDRAATAASGTPTDDGWNVWRILPDGITLLEAYRSRFS